MNTFFRKSISAGFSRAVLAVALLILPLASRAQSTFFGSGSSTNGATDSANLAFGFFALYYNTTGSLNTACGYEALVSNDTGSYNTATGYESLAFNTAGGSNTATGFESLYSNSTGYHNLADGYQSLYANTTGSYNTAIGNFALTSNNTGLQNTASGAFALRLNTTGHNNIALGYSAGYYLTTGSNNIAIGSLGVAGESGDIRIGTTGTHKSAYIAGISGVTSSAGVAVYINSHGQLGTIKSSRRFKNAIKDMDHASDRLMQLRPVTFRYKDDAETGPHSLQYGLIAEEVAKVYPDLVQYDKDGKPFTIYYHLLTPMLLNELQKAHHRFETQETEIKSLKASQKTEIDALKSELASLKQSQQRQLAAFAKLTALVEASQNRVPPQQVTSLHH